MEKADQSSVQKKWPTSSSNGKVVVATSAKLGEINSAKLGEVTSAKVGDIPLNQSPSPPNSKSSKSPTPNPRLVAIAGGGASSEPRHHSHSRYSGLAVGSSPPVNYHRREASDPGCLKAGGFFSGELSKPGSKNSPPYLFRGSPTGSGSPLSPSQGESSSSSSSHKRSPTTATEIAKSCSKAAPPRMPNVDNLKPAKVASILSNGSSSVTGNILGSAKTSCSSESSSGGSQNGSVSSRFPAQFSGNRVKSSSSSSNSNNVSPVKPRPNSNILNSGNVNKVDASCGNILRATTTATTTGTNSAKFSRGNGVPSGGESVGKEGTAVNANAKRGGGLPSLIGPEELKNAGNEQYRNGKFAEALALYNRAIALSPLNASLRTNKAAALSGLGQLAEAVIECEESLKLDPEFGRAHQRLASLYLRLGLVESAKKHCKATMTNNDCPEMQRILMIEKHISKCIEARKSGGWKAVIRESDAAVVSGADSAPQLFAYKAEALLKLHKPEEADTVLSAAQRVESTLTKLGVTSEDSLLYVIRAQIDMNIGRFESAVAAAESAARADPRSMEVLTLLRKVRTVCKARATGNEVFKAGRFYEACAAYGEGLECDPMNPVLLCNRAACRLKLKQWEKAVEDCDAALSIQPNYVKARMRRANCHAMLERWEEAIREYEELSREVPEDMEVARGLFEAQVALKKSKGEDVYKMKFGGEVEEVSSDDHFKEVITSPGLAVVEFNTRWSPKCKEISPFVDQLCKRFPSVNFLKVDVDDNPCLAKTENVSFVPTFKLYKNGQKLKEILGPSQQALEYAVKHYIF